MAHGTEDLSDWESWNSAVTRIYTKNSDGTREEINYNVDEESGRYTISFSEITGDIEEIVIEAEGYKTTFISL
ncbi:hemoblobin-interacting domain-containing protein [Salibacterium aidingense]|uniref:hemoblobin-interacting domain-containing protein n=1 Tax=Salibacterium aidingense TaxID=384933 RepID=UPI003BDBC16D